jgi:hypothetical protein
MRHIIVEIRSLFRTTKTTHVTDYVQAQYDRIAISPKDEVAISLHDCNEVEVASALRSFAIKYDLTYQQLVKSVMIVPAIDQLRNRIVPIFEFRSSYFEGLINDNAQTRITNAVILRDGDMYEFSGNASKIEFNQSSDAPYNRKLIAAAVNAELTQGDHVSEASCSLVSDELEKIREQYISIKFGGLNPLSDADWDDLYLASVFRRAMRDPAFYRFMQSLDNETTRKLEAARDDHNAFFNRQKESENVVRDRFNNRIIGRKIRLYTAEDVAVARQKKRFGEKVKPVTSGGAEIRQFPDEPQKVKDEKKAAQAVAEAQQVEEMLPLSTVINDSFNGLDNGFNDNGDDDIWYDDIDELMDI